MASSGLDANESDLDGSRAYSMRLRHALPTPQGVFEAFEGRWVYRHGEHPSEPYGIGDAPQLPGFERVQGRIDAFAAETAERVREARELDLPLYALLVDRFMGGSMPPPMHSVAIHETAALGQALPAAARGLLRGIGTLKAKVDPKAPIEQSIKQLETLRGAQPNLTLRVDMGGSMAPLLEAGEDPRPMLERLAALNLDYLEDPVPAKLIDTLPSDVLPLALDLVTANFDRALEVVQRGQIKVLVLKPQLCGSYARCFTIARTARARGVRVVLSSMYDSPIGIVALLHLAIALGLDGTAHGLNTLGLIYPHPCPSLRPGRDGRILLPRGPGLGLGEGPWTPELR